MNSRRILAAGGRLLYEDRLPNYPMLMTAPRRKGKDEGL